MEIQSDKVPVQQQTSQRSYIFEPGSLTEFELGEKPLKRGFEISGKFEASKEDTRDATFNSLLTPRLRTALKIQSITFTTQINMKINSSRSKVPCVITPLVEVTVFAGATPVNFSFISLPVDEELKSVSNQKVYSPRQRYVLELFSPVTLERANSLSISFALNEQSLKPLKPIEGEVFENFDIALFFIEPTLSVQAEQVFPV